VDFTTLFMGLCLALFGATAVVWLLDMVGVLTIRTPAQRKMLNASLGVTLIGGMASFAVGTFFTPPGADTATAAGPATAPATTSSPPVPTVTATATPPAPQPAQPETPADPALSEPVRAFLAENNLVRPTIAPDWKTLYPACAEKARTAQLPAAEARQCFRALDRFNNAVLIPYQDAYADYVPDVAELSYRQPAGEVLEFLRSEAGGFSTGSHAMAALYRTISNAYAEDAVTLRKMGYR
jgi:hypothetical protein